MTNTSTFRWDPTKGHRLRPAWHAAIGVLSDGAWHRWRDVVHKMLAASDILPVTCSNLVYNAIRDGDIQRQGEYSVTPSLDTRQVRLTEDGMARWITNVH